MIRYMFTAYSACLLVLVTSFGMVPAQAQSTTARERTLLAESFAAAKVGIWRTRLNLEGWKVSVVVSRASQLKPKTLGNIHWDRDKKTAVIRVLDPADYTLPLPSMLEDIEFTVVHELIHLEMVPILSDLERSDENRIEEEHAVNRVAEALLSLDRKR